eukprot:Seg2372.2 transcript_id=Seg2372.2/GoldUCD/mRNA.D3Y31 product="JmjC domain-containing protein 5" protein_id=Seg2372.2/GoldUCD/D3Y31
MRRSVGEPPYRRSHLKGGSFEFVVFVTHGTGRKDRRRIPIYSGFIHLKRTNPITFIMANNKHSSLIAKSYFGIILMVVFGSSLEESLRGHHGKLGQQCEPSVKTAELEEVPQPELFYEEFIKKNRPVVFRGAAKRSRAFSHWTEEYLKENFSNLTVRLEARAEDNHHLPTGKVGLGLDLLGNFMINYQNLDGYIISQIATPMEKDVMVPPCLRCGTFAKSIQEVHVFLSAAGGKTALHKDPYNNIHCVFNGTKDWILIHPNQTHLVYMSLDSNYEWGGLSDINVDDIDLEIYPDIVKIQYSKIRLFKGDCIFMPSGYWHQVRSFGYMNSAVSMWFSFFDEFDNTGCNDKVCDFTPMNEVDIIWRYSGFGNLTQGHMDIYILQKVLLLWADENGRISLRSFVDHFFVLMDSSKERPAMVRDIAERKENFLRYLDAEDTGYTTKNVIRNLNIQQLTDLVEVIHPNDISNTDVLEYGHLDVEEIRESILESLTEDGKFDREGFIQRYTKELGGTEEKAKRVVSNLNLPMDGKTTKEQLMEQMDKALEPYLDALIHDPGTEKRLYQFLKSGKAITNHDEL